MSKKILLRTTTHIHQEGALSLCGLPIEDMLTFGDQKKIGGVENEDYGCLACMRIQVEQWDNLNEKIGVLNEYTEEDFDSLVGLLDVLRTGLADRQKERS